MAVPSLLSCCRYKREVSADEAIFAKYTSIWAATNTLYEYADHGNDRFAMYESKKYPWIDSAGFFKHEEHLAKDFDTTLLEISGRSGPGHCTCAPLPVP